MNEYKYHMYLYDMHDANDYGVFIHPQEDMKNLGIKYVYSECNSIAECWYIFTDYPLNNYPSYIRFIGRFKDYKHWREAPAMQI